jgi:hypothetical protein
MAQGSSARTIIERIEDALREVATLFVALAPLDVTLGGERPHAFSYGLIFVAAGVSLFALSLFLERRRFNA